MARSAGVWVGGRGGSPAGLVYNPLRSSKDLRCDIMTGYALLTYVASPCSKFLQAKTLPVIRATRGSFILHDLAESSSARGAKTKTRHKGNVRHHDGLRPINLRGFATWQVFASKNIARHHASVAPLFCTMSLVQAQAGAKRKTRHKGNVRHHDGLRPINLRGFATWQVFASKNIARHRASRCDFCTQMSLVQAQAGAKRKTRHKGGFSFWLPLLGLNQRHHD